MNPQNARIKCKQNPTNTTRTQRETLDNGGVRNGRITTMKPNVTNEGNCFSF